MLRTGHRQWITVLGGVVMLELSLTACSASPTPSAPGHKTVSASCTTQFSTVQSMSNSSDLVITGEVLDGANVTMIGGIPFTVTPVKVTSVLKDGRTPGATIQVRQLGPGEGDAQPILVKDSQVFLALNNFVTTPGAPATGQFVPAGCGQGLYERNAGGTFTASDPVSGSSLPTEITPSEIAR